MGKRPKYRWVDHLLQIISFRWIYKDTKQAAQQRARVERVRRALKEKKDD